MPIVKSKQGFAAISPERRKEIASMGGKAAHRKGTAHVWTTETAKVAGYRGGKSARGGRGKLIKEEEKNES